MAYSGPFSKRQLSNLVHIVETELQFQTNGIPTNTDPIILDATTDFSRTTNATVTDNPVADKSDRADHYRVHSPRISFSGVISNDLMVSLSGVGTSTSVYNWAFGDDNDTSRCQQYIERLERIFKEKRLVSIRLPDGLSTDNCLITKLVTSRDKEWGNGFKVDIEAKQIQILNLTITSEAATDFKNSAEPKKSAGSKTGVELGSDDRDVILKIHKAEPTGGQI